MDNDNPTTFAKSSERVLSPAAYDDDVYDAFDGREIFDLIRSITDPEHPLSLEELNVVCEDNVSVDDDRSTVDVLFTPTIPHCTQATLIGLAIRVRLFRALPSRFKVTVKITPGTHDQEYAINKQLGDKERVAAALENSNLLAVVNGCLQSCESF
ncbi:cytosolic iron-sulfur assembly component 2B-like [Symsagittifera roscoffensis]|uniref:cytosolic iron-sulfur assembly component 2B-like n=1 Tax=Symsagittifera roscoffensis TaxID=84072 RepID=UPI00307B6ADA